MKNATLPPPPPRLRAFLLGNLRDDECRSVESWIESNSNSSNLLDKIEASDSLTSALAAPCPLSWDAHAANAVVASVEQKLLAEGYSAVSSDIRLYDDPPATFPRQFGPYTLLRVIGQGGMGVVYEAKHDGLERQVAVKVLRGKLLEDPGYRERFKREAQLAAAVSSDHVVNIFGFGEVDGCPYLEMQLLSGSDLGKWRKARAAPLDAVTVVRIVRELLTGLADLHKKGVIHRDLKPSNLFVEAETGRLKVIDCGLARRVREVDGLTLPGALVGTPAFMAPEQAYVAPEQAEGRPVDDKADLFSAGVLLYWLFDGRSPFQGATIPAALWALKTVDPKQPLGMPDAIWAFTNKLLAKSPAERPQDAREALDEWNKVATELLANSPTTIGTLDDLRASSEAATEVFEGPNRPPRRPWRWVAAGAAGCVGALALAAIILIWRDGKPSLVVVPDGQPVEVTSGPEGTVVKVPPQQPEKPRSKEPVKPPPPWPVGRCVKVKDDLVFVYAGDTSDDRSGSVFAGATGVVKQRSQNGHGHRLLIKWDVSSEEGWVSEETLHIEK